MPKFIQKSLNSYSVEVPDRNPARGESEVCDGENLMYWSRFEVRLIAVSSVNQSTKQFNFKYILNLQTHFKDDFDCSGITRSSKARN